MARSGKMKAKAPARGRKTPAGPHTAPLPDYLTMRQAARNAEGRRNLWSGSQLRHRAVNFVSADATGSDETDTPLSEPNEVSPQPLETKPSTEQDATAADFPVDREKATDVSDLPNVTLDKSSPETCTPNPEPERCLLTPADSPEDSSEDEIVFRGRCNTKNPIGDSRCRSSQMGSDFIPTPRYATEDETGRTDLDVEEGEGESSTSVSPELHSVAADQHPPVERSRSMDLSEGADYVGLKPTRAKRGTRRPHKEDESDPLDDYIAHMDGGYEEILRAYNLKGDLDTPEPDSESSSQRSSSQSATHDLDSLFGAGSQPPPRSKRRGTKHNLQLGSGLDDFLVTESEAEEIDLDVLQSEIVEQSSRRGRKHRMSELWPFQLPSASADALEFDPLYDLDILGLSKADLKKKFKKKQRHMALELDLSDSELEFELQEAWQRDRGKKKIKKQKREELRAQGMLGRGAAKPDLRVKYSSGMDMDEFRAETKKFLLSSKNSLALPPMKKPQRKLIHELAAALSLKSQSRGHGPSRFPVLNKTGRTPVYSPKTIDQVDKIFSSRRFTLRVTKSWNQDTASRSASGRRSRKDNSASYMDGDVVGGSAPEIGAENRGRAMLEKMGWSMGTALGATNNKGILLPVAHVVKNSRTGLG